MSTYTSMEFESSSGDLVKIEIVDGEFSGFIVNQHDPECEMVFGVFNSEDADRVTKTLLRTLNPKQFDLFAVATANPGAAHE